MGLNAGEDFDDHEDGGGGQRPAQDVPGSVVVTVGVLMHGVSMHQPPASSLLIFRMAMAGSQIFWVTDLLSHRSLMRMLRDSIFMGAAVRCSWMPMRPSILRPALSSSMSWLITWPLINWIRTLPRAMMWASFQSSVLMKPFSSAPSPTDPTLAGFLPPPA